MYSKSHISKAYFSHDLLHGQIITNGMSSYGIFYKNWHQIFQLLLIWKVMADYQAICCSGHCFEFKQAPSKTSGNLEFTLGCRIPLVRLCLLNLLIAHIYSILSNTTLTHFKPSNKSLYLKPKCSACTNITKKIVDKQRNLGTTCLT